MPGSTAGGRRSPISWPRSACPAGGPTRVWDVTYTDVDLTTFTDFLETRGLRLAGRASGRTRLAWTLGRLGEAAGEGSLTAAMPAGVVPAAREVPAGAVDGARRRADDLGPFSPHNALGPLPIGGQVDYAFDGDEIRFAPSAFATAETYVAFEGRTAWGQASRLPFHVSSTNWQESHRFLTGIMTMVASPTASVPVDGVGAFDGVMLGALASPRVEGTLQRPGDAGLERHLGRHRGPGGDRGRLRVSRQGRRPRRRHRTHGRRGHVRPRLSAP